VYSTIVYQYISRQIIVTNIGNSTGRYTNVYSKTLKLHKGVDNRLQFQLINQDQKPIDITNLTITLRIIGADNVTVLFKGALTPTLALNGLAEIVIESSSTDTIEAQRAYYTLESNDGTYDTPLFTDQNSVARGVIDIVDSILPQFQSSTVITIPSHAPIVSTGVSFTSSLYNTNGKPHTTIQVYMTNYSGNINVQGSTTGSSSDGVWYDIQDHTYTMNSNSVGYLIDGYHAYIRLNFYATNGSVDNILVR